MKYNNKFFFSKKIKCFLLLKNKIIPRKKMLVLIKKFILKNRWVKVIIDEITINPKKISIKKLLFVLKVIKLTIPENDNERTIIDIKKTNNSRIIIK